MTSEDLAKLISAQRVLLLHRESAERYGGIPTQREHDVGCVDGRIGAAANAAAYLAEGDDDLGLIVAAHLLYYLAKDHCFIDGNKRIAWLACIEFFKNLQLTLRVTEDEAYEFMLDVTGDGSTVTPGDVAIWLAERLEAVEDDLAN